MAKILHQLSLVVDMRLTTSLLHPFGGFLTGFLIRIYILRTACEILSFHVNQSAVDRFPRHTS